MGGRAKYEIYMDGGCAFCQWVRARVEPFDTDRRLEWVDYNEPEAAKRAPFTREELDKEMHVRAPDGKWYAGFEAWLVVLNAMPFLAWLGGLLSNGFFRRRGPRIYAWVARNRRRLPGEPPPCRGDACAAPAENEDVVHSSGQSDV